MLNQMIPSFPMSAILGVGHFELLSKLLYFTNALAYRYDTNYKNVRHRALMVLKNFGHSATLWSKVIKKFNIYANNV